MIQSFNLKTPLMVFVINLVYKYTLWHKNLQEKKLRFEIIF